MARDPRGQTPPLLIIALVLAGGLALRWATATGGTEEEALDACGGTDCDVTPANTQGLPRLTSEAVCGGAGYLCAQLVQAPHFQVFRWQADRPPLRVEIVLPEHEDDPARAEELRRAAVRGIQAWQGKPLPLSIMDRGGAPRGQVDIRITWVPQLEGSVLGSTLTRWETTDGGAGFTSANVTLATQSPFNRHLAVSAGDIQLVAAHEMGHALGLPHSDYPEDLMFPTNTATRLSARDYRTMEALYSLPNGATVSGRR